MDCNAFIQRQLSAVGWAPVAPGLVKFLCPEVRDEHHITAWLTMPDILLRRYPRTVLVRARIEGFGVVPILTRSTLALAERIAYLTGGAVEILEDEAPRPQSTAKALPEGNPPRTCKDCGNLTNGGNCLPALNGQWPGHPPHFRPSPSQPRRCLRYTPGHHLLTGDYRDARTGRELWPEMLPKGAAAIEGCEPAGALGKAGELLAELLAEGPRNAGEILAAGQSAGLSERTMQRASEVLVVVKTKDGHGGWRWALPGEGVRVAA